MHKSKIKQITLAVCLAFMPFSSYAAGLGKLSVNSGLGEPFKAEVELLSVTPEELSTLSATIAPEEAYTAQGIARLGIHNNILVEVSKNTTGSPILRLRSTQPVSDPYLDVLIQVDWATGRLQREYTVLLDPPGYKQPVDNGLPMAISPPSANTSGNSPSSSTADIKRSSKNNKARRSAPSESGPVSENLDEVTTQRGDTLGIIAKQMQVEGVSLDQMLIGLYENNKTAFAGGNINRLKVGQIIRVPSKEVLTAVSRSEASKNVKVHSENWTAYRNNLAGVVAEAPAAAEAEQKQAASGKIGTAEDKAAPVKSGPQDVVKLSGGDKELTKANKDSAKEFESKIAALQEETTAREKSLKEAQDRTAALEKQIQDMQKLLALKNQAMTDAQKNAEAAGANTPPATTPSPTETPEASAETKTDTTTVAPQDAANNTAAVPVPTEQAKPVEQPQTQPKKKVLPPPPVEPEAEEGILASISNYVDLTVLAALGGVALLGGVWMFLRNKRRKDLDSFERGILTSGGLRANTVFGNTTGTASTSDTSFLTDFAQSADGSMIDTNDVDPIAEAEVYMAYGRDAQAEEILKDAISKEPKRYELHLKLLEMYAARKDTSAFEAIAGELYTTLGANDPTWVKVAEIGHGMEPENPLYDVSKAAVMSASATQKLDASDFADIPVKSDAELDFSLGSDDELESAPKAENASDAVVGSFTSPAQTESELSFDLGSFEPEAPTNETASPVAEAKSTDNTMDFDLGSFDLGTEATQENDESMKTMDNLTAFNAESNEINFEAPAFEMPTSTDNEAATNDNSFNMDFNLSEEPASDPMGGTTINDFSFDLSGNESQADNEITADEEISFDLPALDENTSDSDMSANNFDLSTISLDLNDSSNATDTSLPEIVEMDAPESADVDIKLDLVAAYLDMNDKEGARELLEEVLKDGGPKQQSKAKDLLASLS